MSNLQPKIIFLLWLFLTLILSCSITHEPEIDRLFKIYDGDVPGAAIMIIKSGEPIFAKAYGLANLEEKIPVSFRTNFRLASITKQFTAMSIMMLIESGKLNFDRTLKDIFPEFPDYGSNITIRHLLQHTAGLVDYESLLPEADTTQVLDKDVLDMMMRQDSTCFPPGSKYHYSNSGYAVLAMVVEKASGQSFAEFLRKKIFEPLGMKNTVAYEKGISTVKYRAYGYAFEDSQSVFSDQSPTSAVLGDGGIYSSIEELLKWDQVLYTDKLVSDELLNKAFTETVPTDSQQIEYGFGWRIDDYRGHRRVYHTGSTCGFRNVIQRYPDDKFSVIILTNRREPDVMGVADRVTDLFLLTK